MSMTLPAEYDLFIDESGTFMETSTVPAERAEAFQQDRLFPSQLAGVLVPRGALTEGAAKQVRNRALAAISLQPQAVHANELLRQAGKERYNRFVTELVTELQRRGWQQVRLVNREQVRYGDRVATYTNLVAELVLRVCHQKQKEGQPRLSLRLYCARVRLGETSKGTLQFLDRKEYLCRVTEYLGFAAVRRGLPQESASWRVEDLHIRSAKDDPELQLCDVISHASHDEFRPCEPSTADVLRAAFGPYDFTLVLRELLDRIDQHLADGTLALSIIALAERLIQSDLDPVLEQGARRRLEDVVERLARLSGPARDPHLAILVSWLEQLIELQRSLELSHRLAGWLEAEVEQPLRQRLRNSADAGSLDWISYALRTWALTASNHRGTLADARREAEFLQRLVPALAGQWEHATLLMRGMVAEAVHRTDCFDHSGASSRMQLVANYYGQLSDLFHAALPGVFPSRVRSDLCAKSLGTWLQSEIFAGLQDPQRLEDARELSDRAIEEFPTQADKERQYQYRSQLETAAGCFPEARRCLARSLGQEDPSHATLAEAIRRLGDESLFGQGFAILHWFRLGTTAALDGADQERDAFLGAVAEAGTLDLPWCKGQVTEEYPTHGILRRVALMRAMRGEAEAAITALGRLGEVTAVVRTIRVVLQAIRLAAHAEVGVLLWTRHAKRARLILDSEDAKQPGLRQLLEDLAGKTRDSFPDIWRVFAPWPEVVTQALGSGSAGESARVTLLRLARVIGY
jgi:hypothetical protein